MKEINELDKIPISELLKIYESDNMGGDCDCSYCREYRRRLEGNCPTCGEPLESHGSGESFPCPNGHGYFVEMEDGE
jgi:predicted amidophosphoribosyltransferase